LLASRSSQISAPTQTKSFVLCRHRFALVLFPLPKELNLCYFPRFMQSPEELVRVNKQGERARLSTLNNELFTSANPASHWKKFR